MKKYLALFIYILGCTLFIDLNGQVRVYVDSVVVSHANCDRLGTVTVYGSPDSLDLKYSIRGPSRATSNNVFTKVKPGTHQAWVLYEVDDQTKVADTEIFIVESLVFPSKITPENDSICYWDSVVQFSSSVPGGEDW